MPLIKKSVLTGFTVFGVYLISKLVFAAFGIGSAAMDWSQVAHAGGLGIIIAAAFYSVANSQINLSGFFAGSNDHILESMSDLAGVGGWELDIETDTLTWTSQTRAIHEVEDNYIPTLGKAIQFYAPEARELVESAVQRGIETGERWDLELPLRTAKGREIWVRAVGQRMVVDGVPKKIYGAFQNVTQQRIEKEKLRKALEDADAALTSLSAYQAALDEHALVSMADAEGHFTYVNDRFCDQIGVSREEIIGSHQSVLFSHRHTEEFYQDYMDTVDSGRTWHGEVSVDSRKGSVIWTDTTVVPITNDEGEVEQFVVISFDITARKKLEESVKKNQEFLAEAVEVAKIGAWERILETKEPILSQEALRLVEVDEDFVPTIESLAPFFHPDDMVRVMEAMDKCEEDGTPVEEEIRQTTATGRNIWSLITGRRVETSDGGIRVAGAVQDITDRKLANLELEKRRKEAESAVVAKGQFLATMSHEIRTPMNGVLGMLELLNRSELNNEQKENVEIAKESAQSLLTILDDILTFSKLDADQVELEHVAFDVRITTEQVVALHTAKAEEKGLTFGVVVEDDVPLFTRGDPTRVRQVLTNLIGNAIKFTESGGIEVRVRMHEGEHGSELRFDVTDTGIGIAHDAQDLVFERFAQEDTTTTRRYGGTGLGLAICKQLVELMDGAISMQSEPGKGSTFSFTLPAGTEMNDDTSEEPPAHAEEQASVENLARRKNLRILVAEDHHVNQQVVRAYLGADGHDVVVVNNGAEALSALNSQEFDLILMDIFMPVLDGVLATNVIRSLDTPYKDIPIIALTANALEGDREKYLEAGMSGYVSKPIEFDQLMDAVARAIAGQGASKERIKPENRTAVA